MIRALLARLRPVHPIPDAMPRGWRLDSIDFKDQCAGKSATGSVLLIRTEACAAEWNRMAKIVPSNDLPPLFVRGDGRTLPEAMAIARAQARLHPPISCKVVPIHALLDAHAHRGVPPGARTVGPA